RWRLPPREPTGRQGIAAARPLVLTAWDKPVLIEVLTDLHAKDASRHRLRLFESVQAVTACFLNSPMADARRGLSSSSRIVCSFGSFQMQQCQQRHSATPGTARKASIERKSDCDGTPARHGPSCRRF